MSVVPAIQKVEVGESWSKVSIIKTARPYLNNKPKTKGLGHGLSGRMLV
jgi:hypothetical protein